MTRTTTRGIAAVATFLVLAGSGGGRIAAILAVDPVTGRRVFLSISDVAAGDCTA